MIGRHLFVPLEPQNKNYYASCNMMNDEGLVYVYLLHPNRGSLLFTLYFDANGAKYKCRYIVPGLDQKTINLINEGLINNHNKTIKNVYSDRYKFVETDEKYEYFVINRLFESKSGMINPTGKFHVFHEVWSAFNEYEFDTHGVVVKKGIALNAAQCEVIANAILKM